MNIEQAEELGRRALAARFHTRQNTFWTSARYIGGGLYHRTFHGYEDHFDDLANGLEYPPDFRDEATLGILLGRVRARYGDRRISASWDGVKWCVYNGALAPLASGPTEVEALIVALEAK